MRIGPRLLVNSILIASFAVIATAALIGGMSFNYGKNILEEEARNKLVLVRDLKADSIRDYFNNLQKQAIVLSQDPTIMNAMRDFNAGFKKYAQEVSTVGMDQYKEDVIKEYIANFSADYAKTNGDVPFDITPYINTSNPNTFALQYNYIFNNPYGIDKEHQLEYVEDNSTYSKFHAQYHSQLDQIFTLFSLEDIFLVNNEGDIVYTVAKGVDFTTSLKNGPYAKTVLGDAFNRANIVDGTKPVIVSEFEAYMPSNDDQSSFVATAIYDQNGKKIGVLIFQIDYSAINAIMTSGEAWEDIGLGKTGEVYLIDQKKHMITDSRFFIENPEQYLKKIARLDVSPDTITRMRTRQTNIGLQPINSMGADLALEGKSGFASYVDYRDKKVIGAFEPIRVSGVTWGVISEIDAAEAYAPVYSLAWKMGFTLLGIMVLIIFFATIVGIGLAKQISVPIENLSAKIRVLSDTQDLTQRLDYHANDEIGDMARAINHLTANFQQTCRETILSTEKMQATAHRMVDWAADIDREEAAHKHEDNYDAIHEKTESIKDAGDSLDELSERLQMLSRQFKVFEAESNRTRGW